MTVRQKILKIFYPVLMRLTRRKSGKIKEELTGSGDSRVSFYSLHGKLNNGMAFDFSSLKGKKVLLVNTASNCGYTHQYKDLQKLYEDNREKLVVIGFPSNDFKEQEKGTDEEIALFCQVNYGVSFPLMQKSSVIFSSGQNPVFAWLTDPALNGWNSQAPTWNFAKYLVDEAGKLTHYFGPSVDPQSGPVLEALNK